MRRSFTTRLRWKLLNFFAVCSLLANVASTAAIATVTVSGTASHPVPPLMYGQMFEDINSGDGGIYGELLQNRAFQQVNPNTSDALYAWNSIGNASINVIADSVPVSSALPNSLQLTIPEGGIGGFGNEGYWGIKVDSAWTYNASFYYKFEEPSSFEGNLIVGLESMTGEVYASAVVPISGIQTTWEQIFVQLRPALSGSSTANNFTVRLDGASTDQQVINFAMFSLFPPTFKDRPNGLRIDIATTLYEMKPSFFRFPGGNNLGQSAATRWQWNGTVGSLLDRPGRVGDWGYVNTDGLGLLEYLYLIEDLEMQPIMAVWAGYSLDGSSLSEDELAPYIQQAIDQINFVIGDPAESAPAALRASLGHPDPFPLTYVEIGNEDFFASATYTYRWRDFSGNLTAAFPQLKFIATSYPFNPILTPTPLQYDNHVYQTPRWFADNAFYYDSFERNGTYYFEGEYASISTNESNLYAASGTDGRLMYSDLQSATGEAAFMTGLERNSDIVFAASYAPLLANVANYQWTPNLISFDANTVYPSVSYYVQKMFSLYRGDEYIPSTLPQVNGTLFWSITSNTTTNEVFIKVVNTEEKLQEIVFLMSSWEISPFGTAEVLTGPATASNSPSTPDLVKPITYAILASKELAYTAPSYSVTVLTVKII